MSAKEVKNEKKKKKGGAGKFILFLLLIIAILALLLFFGKGFGFGSGSGDGDGNGDSVQAMATTAAQSDAPATEESGSVTIEIKESTIAVNGEIFDSYEAFEEYFYENKSVDKEYVLKDSQAIKSVYDSVKALLDSFSLNYSEAAV